jgi:hypothetical protein
MFGFLRGGTATETEEAHPSTTLFPKTDPAVDGEDCLHDCDSCTVKYPKGFKIDEDDDMYGKMNAWATHLVVATSKADWKRDVADEKGSVMEAVNNAKEPANGRMILSASNMPTPDNTADYNQPTTALLLPSLTLISNLQPSNVPLLLTSIVSPSITTTSPLSTPISIPAILPDPAGLAPPLHTRPCPHNCVILMCSQRTRDARCGQSAPLLRREMERFLRPLGLYRDMEDERPGGVGIYFVSHVGGHKYSANVLIYRKKNAFGQDDLEELKNGENGLKKEEENGTIEDGGAAQCIWLGRVFPEDCENLVRYTVLKGKVVKPERQLRGGFDRARGVMSW